MALRKLWSSVVPDRAAYTWVFLLLATSVSLGACGGPSANLPYLPPADTAAYRLGPGDQIRIITVGGQELTGEFRIGADGNIAVPMIGNVAASGLTPVQLGGNVSSRLRQTGLIRNPSVSVEVVAYRPIFVLGEVNRPGQFPFEPGSTVVTAVAVAGGFTYRAVKNDFSVVRTVNGRAIEGRAQRQTFLQPGDVLTVYERRF